MALAQGSGELIWWPYIIAKYGLTFLCLLIPACLLQYPISVEIGRYTLLTGESIFRGFIRLNRSFGIFLWLLMTLSFLWFGAFASAGGTALAALSNFPEGWSQREQTLFWGYLTIAVFVLAVVFSKVIYHLIENFMKVVALVTIIGLLWACAQLQVIQATPVFMQGLLGPVEPMPRPWDPADATKLLTAVTFAGLGGFWILFYSYWLRDKGSGMATYMGRITGPRAGHPEVVSSYGFLPQNDDLNHSRWQIWKRFLKVDVSVGIMGNLLTTLLMCLLAWALLFPNGLIPQEYEIAVVQSRFFEVSWGTFGRVLFLIIAAAFLADTWLVTADAVSRTQTDIVQTLFPKASRFNVRQWYFGFFTVLTMITGFTMMMDAPGALILISAVIGFAGTVIFPAALYLLNYRLLGPHLPAWGRPSKFSALLLGVSFVAYFCLAAAYLWFRFYG